ncbi:hypothetical protein ACFXA3_03275 [Streptomyces sp. NPDC059456]|uniref:hypothetical protein n=1 Tax=Streptomyces sp. NPDC059456 TaxID=3346838 RepID=UPI0036838FB8
MRAALLCFDPAAPEFIKRYLAIVLRQWELAGRPVPGQWVERAHRLIDAQGPIEDLRSLLDELPHPPI